MNHTQAQLARTLKVGQDTVSRYERRTDMLLSTLQQYVQAMGGELDLIARFPNRRPVRIKALRELADGNHAPANRAAGAAQRAPDPPMRCLIPPDVLRADGGARFRAHGALLQRGVPGDGRVAQPSASLAM